MSNYAHAPGSLILTQQPSQPPECAGTEHAHGNTTCANCRRWMCSACRVRVAVPGPIHLDLAVLCEECER